MNYNHTTHSHDLVTVLLPTYRESVKHFSQAVDSILNQTYPYFELLIILDDPTNIKIKEIAQNYYKHDSRIRLIENKKNKGLVYSLNESIPLAKGAFICRMDADDISKPNRLINQIKFLKSNNLDLVGGRVETISNNDKSIYITPKLPQNPKQVNMALSWNNCIPHPTWLGKREVFGDGYREVPFSEDYDFLIRAALKHYRLGNCNEIVLSYRLSDNSISRNNLFRQYLAQQELTRSYKQNQIPNIELINKNITSKYSQKKDSNFFKANTLFNECLKNLSERNYFSAFIKAMQIPFISREYMNKIYRFIRVSLLTIF